MPRGPLGFPRLTSFGPLTRKTDSEVTGEFVISSDRKKVPEAAVRRTIIDLDNVTGAGRPPIRVEGISTIAERGQTANYDGEYMNITIEPIALTVMDSKRYKNYLKGLVAHEYIHFLMKNPDEQVRLYINKLDQNDLFDIRDLDSIIEYYDFPESQRIRYDNLPEFTDDILEQQWHESSYQIEGLANSVAARYSRLSFDEYNDIRNEVHERSNEVLDNIQTGDITDFSVGEEWYIRW